MTSQYNEQALESLIEKQLPGYSFEVPNDKSLSLESFYETGKNYQNSVEKIQQPEYESNYLNKQDQFNIIG